MDPNDGSPEDVFFEGAITQSNPKLDTEALGTSTKMTVIDLLPDATTDASFDSFIASTVAQNDVIPKRNFITRMSDRIGELKFENWVTFGIVTMSMLFVFMQLSPNLIFTNSTPTGGDMGAHVWGPAFMRDHLLPSFRFTGWTKDYYAGMPMFFFYMVPPALAIILLSLVMPYGVAFKLVSISGLVSLPFCCYFFGRMMRLRFPGPALFAVAAVPFLFYDGFTIYGGNIFSTMAGEYSYSIGLSFMMLFLGVFYRGLDTGKHRVAAGLLFALTVLSHVVAGVFAAIAAIVVFGVHLIRRSRVSSGDRPEFAAFVWDRKRLTYAATVGLMGAALAGFWLFPLQARLPFTTNMRYEKKHEFGKLLLPGDIRWVFVFACLGFIWAIVRRVRGAVFVGLFTLAAWITVVLWPEHQAWNMRYLPYWFLGVFLMAGFGLAEICRGVPKLAILAVNRFKGSDVEDDDLDDEGVAVDAEWLATTRALDDRFVVGGASVFAGLTTLIVGIIMGFVLHILPFAEGNEFSGTYTWPSAGPISWTTTKHNWARSWVKGNFEGYERRAEYGEYNALVSTMGQIGKDKGCGRALWENVKRTDSYGSSLALMLLPHWTQGCIGSMEGLYYETSATTPYHFLTAALTSDKPSNPVRGITYDKLDLRKGVNAMRLLGVKYYMAYSEAAKTAARGQDGLTKLASSAQWEIYQVNDAAIVTPLSYLPAVITPAAKGKAKDWQDYGVDWFSHEANQNVYVAETGPADWPRVVDGTKPLQRPLDPIVLTNVVEGQDTVNFDVSQVGVPVLVRESYFPNWEVEGADGPYRVTPNFMVVIPRSQHVRLHFAWTSVDYLGWIGTISGLLLALWLGIFRRRPVQFGADPVHADAAIGSDGSTWFNYKAKNDSPGAHDLEPTEPGVIPDEAAERNPRGVFDALFEETELPPKSDT